jgi:putative endonuclease
LPRRGPGHRAERRALWHYRLRGYRILAANVWCAGCELDLIVRRGRRLVFVEVKSKSASGFGAPEAMVDARKRQRLLRAAEAWLARNPACRSLDVSFEVMAVEGDALRRVPLGDPV